MLSRQALGERQPSAHCPSRSALPIEEIHSAEDQIHSLAAMSLALCAAAKKETIWPKVLFLPAFVIQDETVNSFPLRGIKTSASQLRCQSAKSTVFQATEFEHAYSCDW